MTDESSNEPGDNLRGVISDQAKQSGQAFSAIILAILIGSLIIYLKGDNPIVAYRALFEAAFGSPKALWSTLAKSTPLIFTGLCAAIAFKSGVINIGGEGQLYMGAIAAALVGVYLVGWPAWLHVSLALFAGAIAGFVWAAPFQWFKVRFGADELVTTTLGNYIAILFTTYLVAYPFKKPGAPLGMTYNIQDTAFLPRLVNSGRLNAGFILAIIVSILLWVLIKRMSLGFEFRMVGSNPRFSRYIGIPFRARQILAMGISGALAGLGGAVEVLGVQHRFIQDLSPGWGFDGILIALLASLNPIAVIPVGILFGALKGGGLGMEAATNVPSELSQVLQAIIVLLVAGNIGVRSLFRWKKRHRKKSTRLEKI